jgi:hypothetical protein
MYEKGWPEMRCPACGNEMYERLDGAIVQCTRCMSLYDPYVFPGFPATIDEIRIGGKWDTRKRRGNSLGKATDPFNPQFCSICLSLNHNTRGHKTCDLCDSHEHDTFHHQTCDLCGSHEHSTINHRE